MDLVSFVVNLVIFVIILAILYYVVTLAIDLLPFPSGPALKIVQIIFVLIFLLWLLSALSGSGIMFYRPGHAVIVR